jgi:DNA polymerase III sliding clamp (beta) subunit (PCNA family)
MKFTVNAGEFSAALRGPCDRTKQHTIIPILKHIRCEASGTDLMLLGHDLDSSSESRVDAEVSVPGACAIPAAPLAQWVAGLHKAATIDAELVGKDIIIKSGRSRCKLPILDAADMPAALSAVGGLNLSVSASDLEQLFVRPRPPIDVKEPRTCFQGFYLHGDGGKVCSVTTNGNFMMRFSTGMDAAGLSGAIIPRYAADEIVKIGAGELTISDRIISISASGRVYCSKIIDATFPEQYRRAIPEIDGPCIEVDGETVLECLSRLRAVGEFSDSDLIDISVGDNEITISVTGVADGAEKIECEASESKFVCLRSSQLLEAVKSIKGETLGLYIRSERDTVRIVDRAEPTAITVIVPCASKTDRRAIAA